MRIGDLLYLRGTACLTAAGLATKRRAEATRCADCVVHAKDILTSLRAEPPHLKTLAITQIPYILAQPAVGIVLALFGIVWCGM